MAAFELAVQFAEELVIHGEGTPARYGLG
jgi:hypothetical protein